MRNNLKQVEENLHYTINLFSERTLPRLQMRGERLENLEILGDDVVRSSEMFSKQFDKRWWKCLFCFECWWLAQSASLKEESEELVNEFD